MQLFVIVIVLLVTFAQTVAQQCPLPQEPTTYISNIYVQVSSQSGNANYSGVVYYDGVNNRSRTDYNVGQSNYSVIQLVNSNNGTETGYISVTTDNDTSCYSYNVPFQNQNIEDLCTWTYEGQRYVNNQKLLTWSTNCTLYTETYDIHFLFSGPYPCNPSSTYIPVILVAQSSDSSMYSETTYSSFQPGKGGVSSYYTPPSGCSDSPNLNLPFNLKHPLHSVRGY